MPVEEKARHHHCPQCVELLSSEAGLAKHLDMLHTAIECQCGLYITMDNMPTHMQVLLTPTPTAP